MVGRYLVFDINFLLYVLFKLVVREVNWDVFNLLEKVIFNWIE